MSARFRVIEVPVAEAHDTQEGEAPESPKDTDEVCYRIEDTQTGDKLQGAYEIKEEAEEACVMHNAKDG
ncbi:hypothetical protein [Salinicola halophyticus]|uniref:hypothetical protein n=1 Tax=Salinicola halophyticus TaxID=1808881 RepID=UPI000DA1FB5B|nr:hypothetical protein [Salinicola halophyticus]